MNSKTGIGVVFIAGGVFIIAGSVTGQLAPMLAALFYPPALSGATGIESARQAVSSSSPSIANTIGTTLTDPFKSPGAWILKKLGL
jgi:hypothetical protein